MPGYILHLTAGAMYLNGLSEEDLLQRSEKARNDFFVGNLMPDAVSDKSQSHFRDPKYGDRMMIWPHLDMFREKYGAIMDEPAGDIIFIFILIRSFSRNIFRGWRSFMTEIIGSLRYGMKSHMYV